MTDADKTEIINLASNVKAMKNVAEVADAPYHDAKVTEFADNAYDDAKEIHSFVKDVFQKNLSMFVNLSCISVGGGFWGYESVNRLKEGGIVNLRLGHDTNLTVRLRIANFMVRDDKPKSIDEISVSAKPEDITVEDVFIDTSDTSLKYDDWEYKNEAIYDVRSHDDLFFHVPSVWKDGNRKRDFRGEYPPSSWKYFANLAKWTRVKSAYLIYATKKFLARSAETYRSLANESDGIREENGRTETYKKVSFA